MKVYKSTNNLQKVLKSSINEDQAKILYKMGASSKYVSNTVKSSQGVKSISPSRRNSDSPTKIAKEFIHCGLGYSPGRRGMLVVDNNAVGIDPIPCHPYESG